ncbi:MAG: hypothetical protein M3198_13825 [Actinomycetota bacterium]|nr:hypothetical protein [Actinomycetota bacterium]
MGSSVSAQRVRTGSWILAGVILASSFYPGAPADAGGGAARVESAVTIIYSQRANAFRGTVSSAEDRCERDRKVLVKKVRKGTNRLVASDLTGSQGRWRTGGFPSPRGRFYAVAKRKEITPPGVVNPTIICVRARSATIRP